MTDNDESWARGRKWVGQACAAVGVSPDDVDIPLILDLTREVAHRQSRPMAPVGAFILGLALGDSSGSDPRRSVDALIATLPPENTSGTD